MSMIEIINDFILQLLDNLDAFIDYCNDYLEKGV